MRQGESAQRTLGILGAGRFGGLLSNLANDCSDYRQHVFFDDIAAVDGERVVGRIADVDAFLDRGEVDDLVVAIGYRHFGFREALFERLRGRARFPTLVHPTSFVSGGADLAEGVAIFSMCNVEVGASLGPNVTVFNQTSVTHDVEIEAHTFLSVGVSMGGGVRIGRRCFVGVNATLVNDIEIGDDAIVCGGTFLTTSIGPHACVIGNPNRQIERVAL